MRIASIHAHPDSAEILAGGTLALLAALGHEILIVSLSAGDCGSTVYGPDEIATIRKAEAAESAALIGAEYRWGGFRDLAIFNDDPSRRDDGASPGSSCRDDSHSRPERLPSDHEATSQLVRDACFAATIPNYTTPTESPVLPAIPFLYFMDPIAGQDRSGQRTVPDFTVNVASTMDTKRAMLAQHRSQRFWLQQQHAMDDYLRQMEDWTRACGTRAGLPWGEGFRQYQVHPYPAPPLLQQILVAYAGNAGSLQRESAGSGTIVFPGGSDQQARFYRKRRLLPSFTLPRSGFSHQ